MANLSSHPVPAPAEGRLARQWRRGWWALRQFARHGRPSLLIHFDGGLGDDLMLTAVFRELRARGGRGHWMMSRAPELFAGNPDVDHVLAPSEESVIAVRRFGVPVLHCHYHTYDAANDRDVAPAHHYIAMMCRGAGLKGRVMLRPYLHLAAGELESGRLGPDQVVVQTSAQGAKFPMPNKDWPAVHYGALMPELRRRFTVVQLGMATDPTFPGVIDLRGRTSLRESAAILRQSKVFIGLPGFLMHVARAVDTRAVIIFGGREDPAISGYCGYENLATPLECAPCWRRHTCPYERECLRRIAPEDVLAAVERQLALVGQPIRTSEVEVPE